MSLKQLTELLALCANYKVYYHVTIDKAFVIPHLDYGDTLYKQAFNNSFHDRLESIQYNACLEITGAIRGTSREKLCQKLGLEPLRLRRWHRKLNLFYKVIKHEHPQYLFHLILVKHASYTSRKVHSIPIFSVKHGFFKNSFFPSTFSEWNKVDPAIPNAQILSIFSKIILHFIRPAPNSIYNCHNPKGVKFTMRFRLGLSHLTGAVPRFPKCGGLERHMFRKALSLVSPAGPIMIGAKGRGKFLNSKGSRSSENATLFKYFLNYFVKILQ